MTPGKVLPFILAGSTASLLGCITCVAGATTATRSSEKFTNAGSFNSIVRVSMMICAPWALKKSRPGTPLYSTPPSTFKAQRYLPPATSMTVCRFPSMGIGSPLNVRIESKSLGFVGGRLPPYNCENCFASNTDTAAPVSRRQRVCFPLILTSTVRSLGPRSLVGLGASLFWPNVVGCSVSKFGCLTSGLPNLIGDLVLSQELVHHTELS